MQKWRKGKEGEVMVQETHMGMQQYNMHGYDDAHGESENAKMTMHNNMAMRMMHHMMA